MSGDINVQSFSGKVNISNNLLVGSSHLFVDTVNNRVGITTASPGASLEVNGNVHVGTDLTLGGTLTGDGSGLANVNSDSGLWAGAGTGSVYLSTSTDKVGIGTATPDARLHVEEPADISATTRLFHTENGFTGGSVGHFEIVEKKTGAGTGWSDFTLRLQRRVDATEQGYIEFNPSGSTGDYGIAFGTGATETMRIDALNGNVGIGTNNPIEKLHVQTPTGTSECKIRIASYMHDGSSRSKSAIEFYANPQFFNGDNGIRPSGYIDSGFAGNNWDYTYLKFKVRQGSGAIVDAMTITNGGNVGIGNTTPTQILDVGSSLSNPFICRHLSGSLHDADKRDSVSFGRIDGSDFLGMKCRVDTHTNLGYGNAANQTKIGFFTWGSNYANSREVMSILGNGNVGIGVTDPDSKLEVRGNIRASFSDTNHGMFIDAGGTILRDYGGSGAGLHFTANAIWPTNYLGSYSAGGIDLGSSSYRWNNVYTEALNASGNVTTGPVLYVGTNTNNETAKTIYFGGTYGDNAYDHCVIERRIWQTGTEKQELLLFSGNDGETTAGPDRIRLKGAQILFDTLNNSTDRTTENTKMTVKSDGVVINSGTLRKPGNPGCRVTMTGAQFTLPSSSHFPIVYDSEYHDTGNDYNTSTGKFTCPVAGKYLCIHMMTTRSTRTRVALSEVKLYHNTTETARQFQDTTQDSACATNVINCAAGDTLYAGIYNANATNEFNGGTEYGSQFIVEFLG